MKRKIALAMSLAMVLTAMPVNWLTAYAEDIIVEEADETLLPETSSEAETIGEVTVEDVPTVVEENTENGVPENTVKESETGTEIPEVSPEDAGETTAEETTKVVDDELSEEILSLDDEILVEEITVEETEVAEKTVEAGTSGEDVIEIPENAFPINSKGAHPYTVTIENKGGVFYSFIPEKSGTYTFYSDEDYNLDPYITMYTMVDGKLQKTFECDGHYSDEGDNGDSNFYFQYELEDGQTYYFNLNDYYNVKKSSNKTGTYQLYVTTITQNLKEKDFHVLLNGSITINAVSDMGISSGLGSLTYKWYDSPELADGGELLSVSDNFTIECVSNNGDYYCQVSDGYSSQVFTFHIVVTSGLVVIPNVEEINVYINKNENDELTYTLSDSTLSVSASNELESSKYEYAWYSWNSTEEDYDIIENEKSSELQLVANEDICQQYKCIVNDEYQSEECEFFVHFVSGFEVFTNTENYLNVDFDDNVDLVVNAKSDFGKLEYVWYNDYDEEQLGTGNTLSRIIDEDSEYYCIVSDGYNSKRIYFYVSINRYINTESNVSEMQIVIPNSSVTLSLDASTKSTYGPISYQWYVNGNKIEGATSNTYTVSNITEYIEAYCRVADKVNYNFVYYYLYPRIIEHKGEIIQGDGTITISHPAQMNRYSFSPSISGLYDISCYDSDAVYMIYDMYGNYLGNGYTQLFAGENYYIIMGYDNPDKTGSYNYHFSRNENYSCTTFTEIERKNPTCSVRGYVRYRCNECDDEYIKYLPASHTPGAWTTTQNATCTTNGLQVQTCSACGTVLGQQVIPATGHSFGGYVVTQSPNALTVGTEVRTCSNCGLQESRPIPQLAGTIKLSATKLPLQLKKTVNLNKLVTSMTEGDYVLSWKSSNAKVASVKGSKVTGKKAGKATLTVTLASGVTKNVTVTVQKGAVKTSGISNIKTKMTMKKGEKVSLKPVISPISTFDKVTYSTSDKKVATVSSKGVITAKASGSAKITVKSGSKKVVITVKVPKTAPTAITGVPTSKTLKKGKSLTLKPKLSPKGAEAKITYKSSNSKVATVNANGKITAKKKGTAVITVKAGNVKATCTIKVN